MCRNSPIRAIDSEWTPPRRNRSGREALAAAINWALLVAVSLNIGMAFAFLRQWYLDRHPLTGPSSVVAGSSSPQWVDDRPVFFSTNTPDTAMSPDIIDANFLRALSEVESGTNDLSVNKRENAHGRYQIRPCYLADANEFLGTSYSLEDMHDPATANTVVWAYLTRWGEAYEKRTGQAATPIVLARIHNGGPRGAERSCTLGYARRFERAAR